MRQFRVDKNITCHFNYTKLYRSSDAAHLIEVRPGVKFWIPKALIFKFDRKKKRIDIKGYWAEEMKLKLKGVVS